YAFQVVEAGSGISPSLVATATPLIVDRNVNASAPSLQLGTVSASELAVTVSTPTVNHPTDPSLKTWGSAVALDTTSLASGQPVHHLADTGQVTFPLPAGINSTDAASLSIYHWSETTGSWVRETTSLTPDQASISAPIDHLSDFILATSAVPASAGMTAQPPASPVDSGGASGATAPQPTDGAPVDLGPPGLEVVSMRTAYSSVFKNPDGSYREVVSA